MTEQLEGERDDWRAAAEHWREECERAKAEADMYRQNAAIAHEAHCRLRREVACLEEVKGHLCWFKDRYITLVNDIGRGLLEYEIAQVDRADAALARHAEIREDKP